MAPSTTELDLDPGAFSSMGTAPLAVEQGSLIDAFGSPRQPLVPHVETTPTIDIDKQVDAVIKASERE